MTRTMLLTSIPFTFVTSFGCSGDSPAGDDASGGSSGMGGAGGGAAAGGAIAGNGVGGVDAAAGSCSASGGRGAETPLLACSEIAVLGFCGECIDEKCCELAEICTTDSDCACMVQCIGPSLSLTTDCLTTCGVDGSPPGFADLAACASTACANFGVGGECTVPEGFQPPSDVAPADTSAVVGIGSGSLPDCGFGDPDPTGSVLQLQTEDASVCVRIERRNEGPGRLANTNWTLLGMRVGPLGEVVEIDSAADICWYSSHHNFNDWAHAWSGTRYYEVKTSVTGHGLPPAYVLHVFERGPVDGTCSPASDGVCPIATMDLFQTP